MARTFSYLEQLERGILTEFRETLWQPFCRSVKRYRLILPGDKIAVCVSGGKDSICMADLVYQLIRSGEMKETYIPTWQGMDLLAAYHGTIPLYLKKYSQWPQKSFEKEDFELFRGCFNDSFHFYDSHTYYEMRWGTIRPEHQKLCNKFGAALICGARSKKGMEKKNIEISGLTTISSNLKM